MQREDSDTSFAVLEYISSCDNKGKTFTKKNKQYNKSSGGEQHEETWNQLIDVRKKYKECYYKYHFVKMGVCIFRPPAHCLALGLGPGSRPWPPICIYRPWPSICIYVPWPPICIYRPWSPPCVYRPWHQICIYQPWPPPSVYPKFVFTGPGLRFVRTEAAKFIYSHRCWIIYSTVL